MMVVLSHSTDACTHFCPVCHRGYECGKTAVDCLKAEFAPCEMCVADALRPAAAEIVARVAQMTQVVN